MALDSLFLLPPANGEGHPCADSHPVDRAAHVESPQSAQPRLSIIIPSYNAKATIGDCLESLRTQVTEGWIEVIVVDSGSDGTAALIAQRFPFVRTYHFPERKFCGAARNWAVSQARADIVAFLDADCTASPNWVASVLKAHERPDLVVGGAIASPTPASLVSWAAFFCEFSQWMPSRHAGAMPDVAGANMSYKRAVFERLGAFLEGTYCSDTEFHWRLAAHGHTPRFDPTIVVTHHNITELRKFLQHEYAHGRDFGRVRAQHWCWSPWKKAAYVVMAGVIPWKLLAQIAWRSVRARGYLLPFLVSLPVLIPGLHAWVLGECRGYLLEARAHPAAASE
jgi:glycosyltransferase involved in cell wall biosynthesis